MAEDMRKKTLVAAVDFDGVIHKYSLGWHGGRIYDVPCDGAKEAMEGLKKAGFKIIIHTARIRPNEDPLEVSPPPSEVQLSAVSVWLEKYNIPYDEIWTESGKPVAHIYIDDRAIRHSVWADTIDQINNILSLEISV